MADSDGQERTEDATSRRKEQAKEKGQVPRSKELASVLVMLMGVISIWNFGGYLGTKLGLVMQRFFSLKRIEILDFRILLRICIDGIINIIIPLGGILLLIFIAAILGATLVGGVQFSLEAAMPKFSKINPLAGIKRIFSKQSVIELIKSILKVALIGGIAFYLIKGKIPDLIMISHEHFPDNIIHSLHLLLDFILLITSSLILIVAIDIPFQIWQHKEQLKMTKQEIKDEYKESEGNPQIKGKLRQLQREAANRKMMSNVPAADVVVTNPEHYSVALRYDHDKDNAPIVVAKGVDNIAMKIREIASEYEIDVIPAPPLARSIYYSTEIDQEVPDGLFVAVAQLLAYVFQLKQYRQGRGKRPQNFNGSSLPIPDELSK